MRLYFITIFICTALLTNAQNPIQNSGFEFWTAGNPDHWITNNEPGITRVTQTTNTHSGNFAIVGQVVIGPNTQFNSPELNYSDSAASGTFYSPFDQLSFYICYAQGGWSPESFWIEVNMYDSAGALTRSGSLEIPNYNLTGSYTQYVCYVNAVTNNPSKYLQIHMYLSDSQTLIQGRWFAVDDFEMSVLPTSIPEKSSKNFNVQIENQHFILSNRKDNFYDINIYSLDGKLIENLYKGELNQGEFCFNSKSFVSGNILSIKRKRGKGI